MLVARQVFDSNTMGRLRLFGAVLSACRWTPADASPRCISITRWRRRAGGTYDETEGLINEPLTVKDVEAVVFFKQNEGDEYRVSLRSKGDVDINAVAKEFGGGGHKNASGCTATGPIEALRRTFVEKMQQAIDGRLAPR